MDMRKTVGRAVMNTVIMADGNRGNGVTEAVQMALVMKTVVLGKTISQIAAILA